MRILRISCVLVGFLSFVLSLPAQTFKTLHSFGGTDGEYPTAGLIQATDGDLYGTTPQGGANGMGTIFKIAAGGKFTTLYSFCSQSNCTDGAQPYAALVQATNGDLYGTTYAGGANGYGTVFRITLGGEPTTLYSFCSSAHCPDGAQPYAALVQATDGDLYGTTYRGGAQGYGTIFQITLSGTLTVVDSFNFYDGSNPYAGLLQATDGNFYGTTIAGGNPAYGTVFKITPGGTHTTLLSFGGANGSKPYAGLVQATDGHLYGTTVEGGAYDDYFCPDGCGTIFEVTPAGGGWKAPLFSFCGQSNCTNGSRPYAGLIQATDGNLYGTTLEGGANGYASYGTVFKITTSGTLMTTLHSFEGTDGASPLAALVQGTNGEFYGTTYYGGANNFGTIFSLSVGLGPFVETNPTSGKVGVAVKILGTDLTGATSVTFNGTAAEFTVVSESEIKTTVPEGATTGTVEVTTPKGTLNSNVVFRVTK